MSNSTLSGGTASVPGTFAWTTPSTVPTASGSYGVTFTPTDTSNYNSVTTDVSVTVNSAVSGPQFDPIYNDQYQFVTSVPTLTIVGTNLDQAIRGFTLVNTTPLMGTFLLTELSKSSTQVTLALPTAITSGTYYLKYDSMGTD